MIYPKTQISENTEQDKFKNYTNVYHIWASENQRQKEYL